MRTIKGWLEQAVSHRATGAQGRRPLQLRLVLAALGGALFLLAGCGGASSPIASCDDFLNAYQDFGSPKSGEMVADAYLEQFPGQDSITGKALDDNLTNVRAGCEAAPDASIDQFVEVEDQTDTSSSYEASSPSSEEPTAPPFKANLWLEMDLEQSDGSTARQRLGLGKLVAADQFVAPKGFAELTDSCEVDYQRDALIPGALILRNTTSQFTIDPDTGLEVDVPNGYYSVNRTGLIADIAQGFSDHQSCDAMDEGLQNVLAEVHFDLGPSETDRHEFLVVLHNYYSPKSPGGDKEGLVYMRFGFARYTSSYGEVCLNSTAPLDGEMVRLDGGPITEEAYDATDLPAC